MPIFKEIPPTAGWAFRLHDLIAMLSKSKRSTIEKDFKGYLAVPYAALTYSGTAALYIILEAVKKISPKRTVIIPSYVCPLVAIAAQRAGFSLEICDIKGSNFDFDYSKLEKICERNPDIAAIVAVHLGGVPVNIDNVKAISKKYDALLIEDCAHALGSVYFSNNSGKQVKCGTLGDFSFFSLCRGKGLSIYEGGMLIVNNEACKEEVKTSIQSAEYKNYFSEIFKIFELIGYWIFYRPQLFWFVFKMPQIFWSLNKRKEKAFGEEYDINFDTHNVSLMRNIFGHMSFYRLETEISAQRAKAAYYIKHLSQINGIKIIEESSGNISAYPFVVLIFDDPKKRDAVLKRLDKLGLGASLVYLNSICEYSYLNNISCTYGHDNASELSRRQMTLSTNSFLKGSDLQAIIGVIKEELAS